MADPARRARAAKVLHRNLLNAMEDPEFRQRLVERGKRLRWTALETPQAKANLAAVRAENGRKRTETVLAWCPPEHRDHYFHLSVTKRMPAAEAKRLVLDHIAREQRRETAKLTPFERQMAALKNGGTLYDFGGSNVQL